MKVSNLRKTQQMLFKWRLVSDLSLALHQSNAVILLYRKKLLKFRQLKAIQKL
jgi:hypothetical protein